MNLELKESLFRFLIPPCLFWGALFLSGDHNEILGFVSPFQISVIFVASGFVISAIGALITWCVDQFVESEWSTPKKELIHWKTLEKEKYVQGKIERVWNLYTLNINSVVGLILSLIFFLKEPSCLLRILLMFVTAIFFLLACINYNKVYQWGNSLLSKNDLLR